MDDGGRATQLTRDVARLQSQVHSLRVALLRAAVTICLVLLLVGLVAPAWHDRIDGDPVTVRVLTAGFLVFAHAGGSGTQIALGIGFLGLLVVVLLLAGLLVQAVLADDDWHPNRGSVVRGAIGTLAVVGTAVAMLLSAIAAGSDLSEVSGGWGTVVLMVGVVLSILVLGSRPLRSVR
jgi:hypothetical protein